MHGRSFNAAGGVNLLGNHSHNIVTDGDRGFRPALWIRL